MCACSPSGKGGFWDPVELPLLCLLLSLLTDKLDLNFLCILWDTGMEECFLGCAVIGEVVASPVPRLDPPTAPVLMLAPQEHVHVAPGPPMPGWIPLLVLSEGVPVLMWGRPFWSLAASLWVGCEGTRWDSDWGWAGHDIKKEKPSVDVWIEGTSTAPNLYPHWISDYICLTHLLCLTK